MLTDQNPSLFLGGSFRLFFVLFCLTHRRQNLIFVYFRKSPATNVLTL